MSSMVIINVRQLRSLTLIVLIKKELLKFVAEIQAMIDNDPSKPIRSIARNMEISEFLIRQVVHEDVWYFSYKMRKGQFLSQVMKDKRKDCAVKFLNKLKHMKKTLLPVPTHLAYSNFFKNQFSSSFQGFLMDNILC